MNRSMVTLLGPGLLLFAITGCSLSDLDPGPSTNISPAALSTRFSPLVVPVASPAMQAQVDLGRQLYYDKRFSTGENTSCNSCHPLAAYGADGHPVSTGHDGRQGDRNAPTVYNSSLNFVQFWDGRAKDLAAQAQGPVLNPVEMGMPSGDAVLARIKSIPGYTAEFKKAFPGPADPVTFTHFGEAIAAFEDGLLTPSRWDSYLEGDTSALTSEEKQGLRLFLKTGCAACHAGRGLGGNSYEAIGYTKRWPDQHDLGRYQVTGLERDRLVFKVPTLRNIAETGPYFHDGKITSLDEAVRLMAQYQCGEKLNNSEVTSIVAFLKSLTGKLPQNYIAPPTLPPAQKATTASLGRTDNGKGRTQ